MVNVYHLGKPIKMFVVFSSMFLKSIAHASQKLPKAIRYDT